MAWWKWQHNTHHAVTNEMDKDPDITTMPLIAWDEEQINAVGPGILMRHQAFLIPVYTAFARIAWLADSFFGHPSQPRRPLKIDLLERSLILAHYAAAMWAAAACAGSVKAGLAFFFASQIIAGWLISSVFIVSHNPMEILKPAAMEGTSFLKAQCLSTCNIKPSPLVDWFTGGLSYQIEHHLFPRMPRHNFAAASKIVSSFCKQHGIPYVTFTFPGALAAVVSVLYRVQTYANRRHAKLRQAA